MVLAVVSGNHNYHAVPIQCGGSVKAYRVHRDLLWGAIEGYTWTVANKGIKSVQDFTVEDIRCSKDASVVKRMRKGEFTKNVAIGFANEVASSYIEGIALSHWRRCGTFNMPTSYQ